MNSDQSLSQWLLFSADTAYEIAENLDVKALTENDDFPALTELAGYLSDSQWHPLLDLLFPKHVTEDVKIDLSLRTESRKAGGINIGVGLAFTPISLAYQVRHQHSETATHRITTSITRVDITETPLNSAENH